MAFSQSRAIVPISGGPSRSEPHRDSGEATGTPLDLVETRTSFHNRVQVERSLPDILGRALARAWIDPGFRAALVADPKETLARHRIHLPESICIDVVTEGQTRPLVVLSEIPPHGGPRRRLMYLQLVMVAGK